MCVFVNFFTIESERSLFQPPTNGHKHGEGDEDKKKHRKHKKKSRHADKFVNKYL